MDRDIEEVVDMCDVGAVCPNCGQPDLDADERSCVQVGGHRYREYRCHNCLALINVEVPTDLTVRGG